MCSVSTRGVWIDLLCLMHKSKKYGYLVHKVDGKLVNMSPKTIQKLTGMTAKRIIIGIQELSKNDVLKRDSDNLIYSKRMVKDHALRMMRKEVGMLGGNPNLVNQKEKQTGNQKPTPSSSSSFSSSTSPSTKDNIMQYFLTFWQVYPHKKSKGKAEEAWEQCFINKNSKYYVGLLDNGFMDKILTSINEQIEERRWKIEGELFVAPWSNPATWLRSKRWDDVVDEKPEKDPDPFDPL